MIQPRITNLRLAWRAAATTAALVLAGTAAAEVELSGVEGALLGGLLLAFAEQFIARYAPIPSGYTQGVPLLFLMIFLLVRPTGLLRARA